MQLLTNIPKSYFSDVNECESSPCSNGATCVNLIAGYHCICPSGYNYTHCQNGKHCLISSQVVFISSLSCQCRRKVYYNCFPKIILSHTLIAVAYIFVISLQQDRVFLMYHCPIPLSYLPERDIKTATNMSKTFQKLMNVKAAHVQMVAHVIML